MNAPVRCLQPHKTLDSASGSAGAYYNAGEVAGFPEAYVAQLVDEGVAVRLATPPTPPPPPPQPAETRSLPAPPAHRAITTPPVKKDA